MAASPNFFKDIWKRVVFFFPSQLVLIHLKKNQALLLFWLFLFGSISGSILKKYGAHNLFLYPEYLGDVNFLSHFITGFAFGGFTMAYFISSYILNGDHFPILATLGKPFAKYCLNSFIIPLSFFTYYSITLYNYQVHQQLDTHLEVIVRLGGLFGGVFLFIFLTLAYFLNTNKSFQKLFGDFQLKKRPPGERPMQNVYSKPERWYSYLNRAKEWNVVTYLHSPTKLKLARDIAHYDKKMLKTVFAQNHVNASIFEILLILSIVFFSFYRETAIFMLPAAASVILILTMVLMLASAIYSWLKGWSTLLFIIIIFGYNYLSQNPDFTFKSYAYGLSYDRKPAKYSNDEIKKYAYDSTQIQEDKENTRKTLENWKVHNSESDQNKPKLVLLNCSGGGLRASMWTFRVLQHLDSISENSFFNQTQLITGSSGGMLGAAYYRELYRQRFADSSIVLNDEKYVNKISTDLLNTVILNLSLHDWLLRLRKFSYKGEYYTKDRGYAFEQQFNENTDGVLDKTIGDYNAEVKLAKIPMFLLSPTITNDGRKLNIASQPVSYLSQPLSGSTSQKLIGSVDYRQLFHNQNPDNLSFLSALRMNATFFYILPNVALPTEPMTEVIDAGVRDNYGFTNTLHYINTFEDWILENTSGIVIVQIRDRFKETEIDEKPVRSLFQSFLRPIEAVSKNYLNIQNFQHDAMFGYLSPELKKRIDVVEFNLLRSTSDEISLSWHLTKKEKLRIKSAIYSDYNKTQTERIKNLLYQNGEAPQ